MEHAIERVRTWTSGPLDLTFLGLKELPELPAGLTHLYCHNNQLTTLPDIPVGVQLLQCFNNHFPDMEDEETIPDYVARVNEIAEAASRDRIVARCALYFQDMMEVAWHPSRVEQWMLAGVDMEDM